MNFRSKAPRIQLLGALLVLVLAFAAVGCGSDDGDSGGGGSTDVETVRPGTLTVGSDIPFPPFEQGRPPDYEGFDIDLSREIAERLDLELQVQNAPFDTIFRDLGQNKFDMVASATTITPEREKAVLFSAPYYAAEQGILVGDGDVTSEADLAGKTIGAQQGTTGADYAKKEIDGAKVRTYGKADDAYNALAAGQVEAVLLDLPAVQQAEKDKEGLKVVGSIDTGENYGLAFAKKSTALQKEVNTQLAAIKKDGTYEKIYRQYFKKAPPKSILTAKGK